MPEKMRTVWELSRMPGAASPRQAPGRQQQRRQALEIGRTEAERLFDSGRELPLDGPRRLLATDVAQPRGQVDVDALVAEAGAGVCGGELFPALGLEPAAAKPPNSVINSRRFRLNGIQSSASRGCSISN